ncbi:MAG: hypothetical protein CML05_15480 [Pseudozobellia sp.]|nr:hypothetical protein [Pseudozobellia sp.]|tara:strand:+ start:99551 stop:100042 length:492 start_codon:yes stop_codon:yes gene_type:complete
MKKYTILTAMGALVIMSACGSSKINAETTLNPENTAQVESSETAINSNDDTDDEMSSNENAEVSANSIQGANGSTGGNANINTGANTTTTMGSLDSSNMYEAINMTDDQITTFEAAMDDFEEKQRSSANGEMLGTVDDERDRQLESILSADQFSAYEKWRGNQ